MTFHSYHLCHPSGQLPVTDTVPQLSPLSPPTLSPTARCCRSSSSSLQAPPCFTVPGNARASSRYITRPVNGRSETLFPASYSQLETVIPSRRLPSPVGRDSQILSLMTPIPARDVWIAAGSLSLSLSLCISLALSSATLGCCSRRSVGSAAQAWAAKMAPRGAAPLLAGSAG